MPRRKKDTPIANLFIAKDAPLSDYSNDLRDISSTLEAGRQVIAKLAEHDIHTYGQLREHARVFSLVDLGIEPQHIERIHRFVLFGETLNKEYLEKEYYKAQEEIARLKQQQPTKQLDKATIDGREIAKSM